MGEWWFIGVMIVACRNQWTRPLWEHDSSGSSGGGEGTPLRPAPPLHLDNITVALTEEEVATQVLSEVTLRRMVLVYRTYGVCVLRKALPLSLVFSLFDDLHTPCRSNATTGVVSCARSSRVRRPIANGQRRRHELLGYDDKTIMHVTLVLKRLLAPVLAQTLGNTAQVVELGAVMVDRGALEQEVTREIQPGVYTGKVARLNYAALTTVFVTADDVGKAAGPLEVWPGSHTAGGDKAVQEPGVRLALPKGSVVMMDPRVAYRGTAHTGRREHHAMYLLLAGDGTLLEEGERGPGSGSGLEWTPATSIATQLPPKETYHVLSSTARAYGVSVWDLSEAIPPDAQEEGYAGFLHAVPELRPRRGGLHWRWRDLLRSMVAHRRGRGEAGGGDGEGGGGLTAEGSALYYSGVGDAAWCAAQSLWGREFIQDLGVSW